MASGAPMARWWKPRRLPQVERGPGGVAQVLVGQLLAVVGGRAPLPLAAAVVVARELVEELRPVDQPPELEHVQLRPLLVGQQHADGLVLLHHRLELAHRRGVVDDQAGCARASGSSMTSQRSVAAQAKKASPRVARRSNPPFTNASIRRRSSCTERWPLARCAGLPQHAVELVLDVLVPHESPSVDVEVARGDRSDLASDPCELPDGGFGDDGHSTSRSRRVW